MGDWSKVPNLHICARCYTYCISILQTPLVHRVKYKHMRTTLFMLWLLPIPGPRPQACLATSDPVLKTHQTTVSSLNMLWHFTLHVFTDKAGSFEFVSSHPPTDITTSSGWISHILSDPISFSVFSSKAVLKPLGNYEQNLHVSLLLY